MPDHFHAIIGTGGSEKTLGQICGAFKSVSNRIYWKYGNGKLWQRQFYDHIIRNEEDFFESLEYIRLNPVRKGLVEKIDDWKFTDIMDVLDKKQS
jgi:REP element-mobilizing transposase RayT